MANISHKAGKGVRLSYQELEALALTVVGDWMNQADPRTEAGKAEEREYLKQRYKKRGYEPG